MTPADRGLQIPERESAPVVDDPAVVAGKEAQEAAAAWNAYAKAHPTLAEEKNPEYAAIKERSEKADDAFADAPVTSAAGALVKMREIAEMGMTGQYDDEGLEGRHFKTVVAYLEELADKTGVALVDLDAEDIARELTDHSWADRARFFNNAIVESLDTLGIVVEAFDKNDEGIDGREVLDAARSGSGDREGRKSGAARTRGPPFAR